MGLSMVCSPPGRPWRGRRVCRGVGERRPAAALSRTGGKRAPAWLAGDWKVRRDRSGYDRVAHRVRPGVEGSNEVPVASDPGGDGSRRCRGRTLIRARRAYPLRSATRGTGSRRRAAPRRARRRSAASRSAEPEAARSPASRARTGRRGRRRPGGLGAARAPRRRRGHALAPQPSSRRARAPLGRARSRDATQARAKPRHRGRPRAVSRSMAPSTRSAGSPPRERRAPPRASAADLQEASRRVEDGGRSPTAPRRARASARVSLGGWRTVGCRGLPYSASSMPSTGFGARHAERTRLSISAAMAGFLAEEDLGRLAALAEPRLAEGEPGPGLGHDDQGHPDVEEAALAADPLAVTSRRTRRRGTAGRPCS